MDGAIHPLPLVGKMFDLPVEVAKQVIKERPVAATVVIAGLGLLIARKPQVTAIGTADYPTPAQRPAYSVLDTTKLRTDFGIAPPGWHEGLRRTLGKPR